MANLNKRNEQIFIVNNSNEIESMTYGEYVREYGADETTSPRGVAPRMHVREKSNTEFRNIETKETISESDYDYLSEEDQENYEIGGENITYQIWTWEIGGNNPRFTGTEVETEEEAENKILENFEFNITEKNHQAPEYFYSEEQAENDRVEIGASAMNVDKEVFISIDKKAKKVAERKKFLNEEATKKFNKLKDLQFKKYSNIIEKIEGETYQETQARLASALPEKIHSSVFHKIIKSVRNG